MTGEDVRPHGGLDKSEREAHITVTKETLVTVPLENTPRPKISATKGLIFGIAISAFLWAAILYFAQ
jgi:hypothetical protein